MKKGIALVVVLSAFAGLIGVAWWWPVAPPESRVTSAASAERKRSPVDVRQLKAMVQAPGPAKPGPLPHSLQGTQPPGGWARVDDGQLVPTPQLRQLFEYYLSALGEEPLATITQRIRQALSVLPQPARRQALTILLHYLDYRLALGQLGNDGSVPPLSLKHPQTLAVRLQMLQQIRQEKLGSDVADAFFGREDALNQYTLARLRIDQDSQMTSGEKAAALAQARAQLPPAMQQSEQRTLKFEHYQKALSRLQAQGADRAQIQDLREQTFGPEAAARLAKLDQAQADWKRRWQQYRQQEQQLDASGLSPQARQDQLQILRSQYFKPLEMPRVKALDATRVSP